MTLSCLSLLLQILDKIINTFSIELPSSSKSTTASAEAIRDFFSASSNESPLYLAIHNIDGPAIVTNIDIIAILAQSPAIRIVATVDHLYADRCKFVCVWEIC